MKKCSKVGYESKSLAVKDGASIVKNNRRKKESNKSIPKKYRPYLCNHCGLWHLTSQKKRKW